MFFLENEVTLLRLVKKHGMRRVSAVALRHALWRWDERREGGMQPRLKTDNLEENRESKGMRARARRLWVWCFFEQGSWNVSHTTTGLIFASS